MKLVAITGSIGCGKTTLANIVRGLGYAVYDVDAWVRKIYNNKNFLIRLKSLFPESVKNGIADKRYLRNIVFSDKEKLKKLEDIIYPILNTKIKKIINKKAKDNYIAFLDIALLFEKNWDKYCDVIVLADVDYNTQKQRVMKRDNISAEDFDKINNTQMNNNHKKYLSDIIIDTNRPLNILKTELINIISALEEN